LTLILLITHDLDLALTYANRVVVLYGGRWWQTAARMMFCG